MVVTEMDATTLYETGFVENLMRGPDDAIVLNDLVLLENDAPGAGLSEKGAWEESIHNGVMAKKVIVVDDTRAHAAHACLYLTPQSKDAPPYYLLVNGHRVEGIPRPALDGIWHWVPVPVELLKQGPNEIVVACDAPEGEGYNLLFAREDEYAAGGGKLTYKGNSAWIAAAQLAPAIEPLPPDFAPIDVGATSARSVDGGATWTLGRLGSDGATGEYTARLHLQRYHEEGTLTTLPIDLWDDPARGSAVGGTCRVETLTLEGVGRTAADTRIRWYARFGDSADPHDSNWMAFTKVAEGDAPGVALDSQGNRYVQVQVRLSTLNPLHTPSLHRIRIARDLVSEEPTHGPVYVRAIDCPELRYSSFTLSWQNDRDARLVALRKRMELDALLEGAEGDFEKINRVRHRVSQLWYHKSPLPDYPDWNAHSVLDRKETHGAGGMCIQFVVVFMGALQSLGYQARHLNLFNHETLEVYVDELGKWVLVDPESLFDSYEFNTRTGEPLNALEQHAYFLERYGLSKERPIPWMSPEPWCNWQASGVEESPPPLDISTATDWINSPDPAKRPPQHRLAGFIRMIPRNDFVGNPTPRPLTHGCTHWPWSGYLCWYDEATPRMLHYALHSDRVADFYPTLNRVAFTVTRTDTPGEVVVDMLSQTPNFVSYEMCIDDGPWEDTGDRVTWQLRPSALNRLEMRVRNSAGVRGKPSSVELFWHYQEPFVPRAEH